MKKIFSLLLPFIALFSTAQNVHYYIPDVGNKNYVDRFPIIRQYVPAGGIAGTSTLTNFPVTSLDSTQIYLTTVAPFPVGGGKNGGVGWAGPVGSDSVLVTAPFIVLAGSSFDASHGSPASMFSRLEGTSGNGGALFQFNYIDSVGTFAYYMRQRTHMRAYPQAVGGQSTHDLRKRWARDVLAQSINGLLDNRTNQTLTRKPYLVFFDGIGNDPYQAGASPQQTENDLIYMAQSCKENGILFICCISTSTFGVSVAGDQFVQAVNKWLEEGGLDPYGAVLFNMRKFWSNPAQGYNGVNSNPNYVNQVDKTHFQLPKNAGQTAGYDSLALAVITQCHVPILTKIVFNTNNDPVNPVSQANFITAATIDGQPYTGLTQNDTFAITRPLGNGNGTGGTAYDCGDSIWIHPTAVSPITGSGNNYYLGYVSWFLDNTAGMTTEDTGRVISHRTPRLNSGSATNIDASSLTIWPENNASTSSIFTIKNSGWTGNGLEVHPGSTTYALLNGATRVAAETFNSGGNINTGSHDVISLGGLSEFGNLQIGFTSAPTAFDQGIGTVGGALAIYAMNTANMNVPAFSFNSLVPRANVTSAAIHIAQFNDSIGLGQVTGNGDTVAIWKMRQQITDTAKGKTLSILPGIEVDRPIVANQGSDYVVDLWTYYNDEAFNTVSGSMGIGAPLTGIDGTAKLDIEDTARGLLIPQLTTSQRNNMGGVTVAVNSGGSGYGIPTPVFTGGSGSGARAIVTAASGIITSVKMLNSGIDYATSLPSFSLIGAGTGATFTVNHLPPHDGLLIFNKTVDSIQQYQNNCSCWIDLGSSSGGGLANPMTTSQDIIVGGSGGTPGRLPVGSNGQVLTVVSGALAYATTGGTYTPTVTNTQDVVSSSLVLATYTVTNNIVRGSISLTVTPTAASTGAIVGVTVPVTVGASTVNSTMIGHGLLQSTAYLGIPVTVQIISGAMNLFFTPTGTGAQNLHITFEYTNN